LINRRFRRANRHSFAVVLDFAEGFHAHSNKPSKPEYIPTTVESLKATGGGITFGPPAYPQGVNENFPKMNETLNVYDRRKVIFVPVNVPADAKPGDVTISATVSVQICNDSMCFPPSDSKVVLKTRVAAADEAVSAANPEFFAPPEVRHGSAADDKGIAYWFGVAFLVGIIFNIVPCVLPVLPLKAIGFTKPPSTTAPRVSPTAWHSALA
jgi:thiol:disulfide interchange protein DsbD